MDRRLLLGALGALAACKQDAKNPGSVQGRQPPPRPKVDAFGDDFWAIWGDGQAELCGYDLWVPRDGKLRRGTAVTVFISEPFSNALRVKAESETGTGTFPVMKMNLIRDYQTGIYDYNDMLCTFVALDAVNGLPAGAATKVSFSSQEWCGHVFSQVLFGQSSASAIRHSYFESEADGERVLPWEPKATAADSLLLWARGMAAPFVRAGSHRIVPLLTSLEQQRAAHADLGLEHTVLRVAPELETVRTNVGELQIRTCRAETRDGLTRTYQVEADAPHRVVRWEVSTGERAELIGSVRLKYWQMNGAGGEQALRSIGLSPRPPRTT